MGNLGRGLLAAAITLAWLVPAGGAEVSYSKLHDSLPFPRSERAEAAWDGRACWSQCGAQCAWGQHACLRRDAQNQCIAWSDACDRFCQRGCRSYGGPLLSITEF